MRNVISTGIKNNTCAIIMANLLFDGLIIKLPLTWHGY